MRQVCSRDHAGHGTVAHLLLGHMAGPSKDASCHMHITVGAESITKIVQKQFLECSTSLQLDTKLVPCLVLGSSLPAASLKRKLLPLAW